MLRAMGVDPATELFKAAGAPLMAGLMQALGPEFNAVLVMQLGKGTLLLGLDLGGGFLSEAGHKHADGSLAVGLCCHHACRASLIVSGDQAVLVLTWLVAVVPKSRQFGSPSLFRLAA
jgi:hypothetical protein